MIKAIDVDKFNSSNYVLVYEPDINIFGWYGQFFFPTNMQHVYSVNKGVAEALGLNIRDSSLVNWLEL